MSRKLTVIESVIYAQTQMSLEIQYLELYLFKLFRIIKKNHVMRTLLKDETPLIHLYELYLFFISYVFLLSIHYRFKSKKKAILGLFFLFYSIVELILITSLKDLFSIL